MLSGFSQGTGRKYCTRHISASDILTLVRLTNLRGSRQVSFRVLLTERIFPAMLVWLLTSDIRSRPPPPTATEEASHERFVDAVHSARRTLPDSGVWFSLDCCSMCDCFSLYNVANVLYCSDFTLEDGVLSKEESPFGSGQATLAISGHLAREENRRDTLFVRKNGLVLLCSSTEWGVGGPRKL
ncbi:hypothetical protein SDJN03_17022, partial [Cucurbita argyrosperma subsp. sororia]